MINLNECVGRRVGTHSILSRPTTTIVEAVRGCRMRHLRDLSLGGDACGSGKRGRARGGGGALLFRAGIHKVQGVAHRDSYSLSFMNLFLYSNY